MPTTRQIRELLEDVQAQAREIPEPPERADVPTLGAVWQTVCTMARWSASYDGGRWRCRGWYPLDQLEALRAYLEDITDGAVFVALTLEETDLALEWLSVPAWYAWRHTYIQYGARKEWYWYVETVSGTQDTYRGLSGLVSAAAKLYQQQTGELVQTGDTETLRAWLQAARAALVSVDWNEKVPPAAA